MKIIVKIFLLLIGGLTCNASDIKVLWNQANKAYDNADYIKATELYESIAASGVESPDLYYNNGNSYFKQNNIVRAIINYERCLKLYPAHEDALYNLNLANQKIIDKIDPLPELFIKKMGNGIILLMSEKGWTLSGLVTFAISLLCFSLYYISSRGRVKKIGLLSGILIFAVSMLLFYIALNSRKTVELSSVAVIISQTVTIKSAPTNNGSKLFILHEGTKIEILEMHDEWNKIKIADGNIGWIRSSSLEKI